MSTQPICQKFTVRQAATELGLSPFTVYKQVAEGRLSHYRLGGRILFSREHLEHAFQKAERPATAA